MKEVLAETMILSALIIVPMAFLGPGWRMPQTRPFADAHRPAAIDNHAGGDTGAEADHNDHGETPGSFRDS